MSCSSGIPQRVSLGWYDIRARCETSVWCYTAPGIRTTGDSWCTRHELRGAASEQGDTELSIPFNADEIFEIAEQIERNADRFYRSAARETDDPGLREKLVALAAMENQHERVLAGMRAELPSQEREPAAPDPWGEAVLYLRGIADGHVFDLKQDPAEWLAGKHTKEDILKAAIGHEKDSIVFYLAMKEVVPHALGKGKIDAIIKEEMGHIAGLTSDLASLNA